MTPDEKDQAASMPSTSDERLDALHRHKILDTAADDHFNRIVALVQNICQVPIALVSLVAADRQWFKAKDGVTVDETALDTSVCALAIRQRDVFQIDDLSIDPRTADMSLVAGDPGIRFYAGAPLVTEDGHALGSLCAIDTVPRVGGLSTSQQEALMLLAKQVMELVEARHAIAARDQALALEQAHGRAQASDDRFRAIVDSATDNAIIAMDEAGIVTDWSKGAERIFGWTQAEMIGEPALRFFTPEDRTAGVPEQEFVEAQANGHATDNRWHLRKDGTRFFAHGAMTLLRGTYLPGFVKAVRDITAEHEGKVALEQARMRAEMMTEAARLGTFDYDPQTDALIWDDGCRALFGLPPGTRVTYESAFVTGLHPDDLARADAAVQSALDPKNDGRLEVDYRTIGIEDGKLRHVAARGQVYFEAGTAVRLIGTVQDVTAARIADKRLREIEERLRLANRATNDPIWDWDLVHNHVTWNEAIEASFGHMLADVEPTGEWWIGHIHPDDRARIDASIHAVINGEGSEWIDDYRFRRLDGSYADIHDRGFVLRDNQGNPLRMIGAMLDQTERMGVERQLRGETTGLAQQVADGEAEMERMWDASPDLMVVLDSNGVFHRVNPAWTELLGYAPDDLIGRHVNEFVLPESHRTMIAAYEKAAGGDKISTLTTYRHRDGSTRIISWVGAPNGSMIYATGRDITAEVEGRETLRQTEDALRQSQKVEAVGQLTGGVAHDFNNLLTVIRGSVDLLRRPNLSDERRVRYIDAISDTSDRATRLTGQLLAFARRQALQPQVFDAAANVGALGEMLRTLTGSRIRTEYDLPGDPAQVMTDPSQFDTAIVNMAVNARDAMNGEGTLTLAVRVVDAMPALRHHPRVDQPHVAISIADTGTGIPADKIEHIFEPFFTTKGVGHGTGLGLSQVFGFAKQSTGDVEVESKVGKGTTFTLYLPVAMAIETLPDIDRRPAQPLAAGSCILVVEDNKEVGEFATVALAELGYGSYWVTDANAALVELKASPDRYDAVFTDVVMPGRSGIELADEIASLFPDLPVVLTSGYSHVLAQEGTRGFELLHKPYSISELADILARVTSKAGG